jgi:prophage antirepressor-like protein
MKNLDTQLALFKGKKIRKTLHLNEWWFVIQDVVRVLTDSIDASDYIKKMRKRDEELSKGWGQFVTPLSVDTAGGKQKLNCANAKGLLRIKEQQSTKGFTQFWLPHLP